MLLRHMNILAKYPFVTYPQGWGGTATQRHHS